MADTSDINRGLFVSTDWVAAHLDDPDLLLVDGSWYLPAQDRDGATEFAEGHIPGAVFFDIDALADPTSGLPHMLLDAPAFAERAGVLGISSDRTLVVYDGAGLFSAPRVWWTLRLFGAKEVFILEGGLPRWTAEGRPLESGPSRRSSTRFRPAARADVASLDRVRHALETKDAQVVDARPAARFKGEAPEPRPGVRPGRMPGSLSLPATALIADGQLKAPEALRAAFDDAGVDLDRPVIATCGSGVTAAILVLAMERLGKTDATLYDGSWSEYGSRPDLPVETG